MLPENILEKIEEFVNRAFENNEGYFLVSVKIKPTNNIKVFIDGDNGVSIEKCVQINRRLYKMIEENALFPDGDFSLEVSSPGIDEPLKMHRQYLKNIGRFVEVIFNDETKKEGKLLAVTNEDILLEQHTGKGKKEVTQQLVIPFNHIKSTTVQIKF